VTRDQHGSTEETTLSDNPIAACYLYLLEPEIRFLEAAVE
jgi:hypothetical protein